MPRRNGREVYARSEATREPYDTVLIVCEGEKTEPNYFNGLIADNRLSSANVRVTNAPGSDPMTVTLFAEELMAKQPYDRAFCVFDRDGHANFNAAVQRIRASQLGMQGRWQAVTSNPCFELWLLLHYIYSTAPIVASGNESSGARAVRELRKHIADYQKGRRDIFDIFRERVLTAIANGRKLRTYNAASNSDNPATDVDILVDYLCRLKQKAR